MTRENYGLNKELDWINSVKQLTPEIASENNVRYDPNTIVVDATSPSGKPVKVYVATRPTFSRDLTQ